VFWFLSYTFLILLYVSQFFWAFSSVSITHLMRIFTCVCFLALVYLLVLFAISYLSIFHMRAVILTSFASILEVSMWSFLHTVLFSVSSSWARLLQGLEIQLLFCINCNSFFFISIICCYVSSNLFSFVIVICVLGSLIFIILSSVLWYFLIFFYFRSDMLPSGETPLVHLLFLISS
jgi:hypothetical protein